MADNIAIHATGATDPIIATEEINGVHYQKVFSGQYALAKQIDFVDTLHFYKGEAMPGTATSSPAWRVSYNVLTPTGNLSTTFADSGNFSQIWNNRTSIGYA